MRTRLAVINLALLVSAVAAAQVALQFEVA
jgi:hypothetical protein